MNLHKVRIQLTVLFSILAAIAVVIIAVIADRIGADRIYDSAEREAEQIVAEVALEDYWSEDFYVENVWLVNPGDEFVQAFGELDVEPPYFTIASEAVEYGSTFVQFEQNGTWLGYARDLGDASTILAVVDLEPYQGDASSLRWRLAIASVALVAFTSAAGYWLAGRSLEPARVAMEQQRHFIADAAHELRTPLSVIQASASHALSRERDTDAYKLSLFEIREAAERAGSGVGELLELARLEAGTAAPRLAPLRLDLLVEEVGAATRVDGANVTGEPGESLIVQADYGLIRQALDNVTANAAARADNVTISSYAYQQWAVIEIADDGPGFDEAVLPHVFQRFRRGDEKGSSGLGMSIVRTIVESHGGQCEAFNRPEGGASVRLMLPAD